jgi:hypothetical protein
MFYFNRAPFYPDSEQDLKQMTKVHGFRESLKNKGVFSREYVGADEFERQVQDHLTQVIRRWRREAEEQRLRDPVRYSPERPPTLRRSGHT